jgi:hypothetical protein
MSEAEDDSYLMANLPPRLTGLPMIVWVSERGNAHQGQSDAWPGG